MRGPDFCTQQDPADDQVIMARVIWALVHGVAMLMIDGQLGGFDENGTALN